MPRKLLLVGLGVLLASACFSNSDPVPPPTEPPPPSRDTTVISVNLTSAPLRPT